MVFERNWPWHNKFCWSLTINRAFEDFGGDNLRPSDFIISIRWGAFHRSIPPTRRVGDMVHCCCRMVNSIFKRLCSDGRISQDISSIPTERRNVEFKMDIRHSFLGYRISRLYFSARAFTHVLELDVLDVRLQMWYALHDTKDKKRRIGRRKA